MCLVSAITTDWYKDRSPGWIPNSIPNSIPNWPTPGPTTEEFLALKREVEELKERLKEARKEDIESDAPVCEMKPEVEMLKKLAELLGVDLEDVFDGHEQ